MGTPPRKTRMWWEDMGESWVRIDYLSDEESTLKEQFTPPSGSFLDRLSMGDLERVVELSFKQELLRLDMESESERTTPESCRRDSACLSEGESKNTASQPCRRDIGGLSVIASSNCTAPAFGEGQKYTEKENVEPVSISIRDTSAWELLAPWPHPFSIQAHPTSLQPLK